MIFLTQSPHAWRGVWQRPHHLATRFAAAGHGVRYAEPRYVKWLLSEPARFLRSRHERPAAPTAGLVEVEPVTLVNGERFAPVRRSNLRRLARALAAPTPPAWGKEPRVLWLYNPHESALADMVPHDLLVYDIMDEFAGFPWSPPRVAEEEAALLARADWVFAGTQALYDAKRGRAEGRIECVLSGVDVEHFASPGAPPAELTELRGRYRRLLGYAGVVDMRIDQPLLAETAARHPDWGFIFLGPVMWDASTLRAPPNIHLLGQRPYAELPAWFHGWDCALIPFVESELTRHINPTKILEYAAAGLPVVSRALPDVERFYADGAFLYKEQGEFEASLRLILEGDASPTSRPEVAARLERSRRWADERSWAALAGKMLARVEGLAAIRAGNVG